MVRSSNRVSRGMPEGPIRGDRVAGKLMLHIDADEPDHPLEKKAWIHGYSVKVKP